MTTPLLMPSPLPVRSKVFDLSHAGQMVTPVASGFIQTLTRTRPFWVAEYETPPLSDTRYGQVQTFLDSLEGSLNTFIGYDPRRPQPLAAIQAKLPLGSAPWVTAQVTAGSYTASTLTVLLGASYTLSRGDYVAFQLGNIWYLHRCQEAKTGTSFSIIVKPRPVDFITTQTLVLTRAGCEMKMMGAPSWADNVDSLPTAKWRAVQYFDHVGSPA